MSADGPQMWYQTTKKDVDTGMKIVKSSSTPSDTSVLWLDTSNASGTIGGVIKYYNPDTSSWVAVSAVWG